MALARRAVCASLRAGARRRLPATRLLAPRNVASTGPSRSLQTSAAASYEVEASAQKHTPVAPAPYTAKQASASAAPSPSSSQLQRPDPSTSRRRDRLRSDSTHVQVRKLLRECAQLFAPASPLASQEWRERLDVAAQRLGQSAEHLGAIRPTRIGIVGAPSAGTIELIETLLDDPLASSSSTASRDAASSIVEKLQKIRDHETGSSVLVTPYELQTHRNAVVTVPHTLLRQHNVEFLQLNTDSSVSDTTASNDLYACDALVFVTDDATLAAHARYGDRLKTDSTLRLLRQFAGKPGTSVAVNHDGSQLVDTADLEQGLRMAVGDDAMQALQRSGDNSILHISTTLAKHANEALRQALKDAGPLTPPASAWDHFTSLYQSSSVGDVKNRFLPEAPGDDVAEQAALASSTFVLRRALEQALFLIWRDVEYAQQARGAAEVLSTAVSEERVRLHAAVLADYNTKADDGEASSGSTAVHERAGDRSKTVDGASKDAGKLVETTFSSRLPWWKILWKVDDVRAETESAIEGAFGKKLEQQLMLETGKLLGIAMRLQRQTAELFSDLRNEWNPAPKQLDKTQQRSDARNPFASPLLLNELRKHSLEGVEAKLRPDLLTRPIMDRRLQLLSRGGPVDVLCQRAQRSVLASVGLTGSAGLLSAVSGVAGSNVGAGMGLPATLSIIALEPATAGASLAFATVFSAWLLQTRWSRAKKSFWRDWERIADGLDDDLKRNLDDVFERLVAAQSVTAIDGLRALVSGYLLELEDVQRDSAAIVAELKKVSSGPKS